MVEPAERSIDLPRSVLVADSRLYRQISDHPNSVALLEGLDAMVIPYSGEAHVNKAEVAAVRKVLAQAGQLAPLSLFVKNPYALNSYELADDALEAFALAKYHALATVAKHLGATGVSFIDARVDRADSSWKGELKGKVPAVKAGAELGNEVTKKLAKRLEGSMIFGGSEPDVDGAIECLRTRNLLSDQQLQYLIELRAGKNPISNYKMTFSGTRESTANFKSALSLTVSLPTAPEGTAAFSRGASTITSIEITTEISFRA